MDQKNNDVDKDDLRDWWKDDRGEPFRKALRGMFAEQMSKMRLAVKNGKLAEAAMYEGSAETYEEVAQLVELLISEQKEEVDERV